MGVGNFFINGAKTVYIDDDQVSDIDENGNSEYDEYMYDDMVQLIREALPTSYVPVDRRYDHDEGLVIAENGFYEVVVTSWTNYYAVSIAVIEQDEYSSGNVESLAKYHLESRSKSFFDKLTEYYDLRIRTCAWTSGSYNKAA